MVNSVKNTQVLKNALKVIRKILSCSARSKQGGEVGTGENEWGKRSCLKQNVSGSVHWYFFNESFSTAKI